MIAFVLAIAVVNLAVGFALAAYLGRCYRAQALAALESLPALAAAAAGTDDVQTPAPPAAPPPPDPHLQDAEQSIRGLQNEVDTYYKQLTETDDKLREITDTPDSVMIQECIGSLQAATKEYCRQRQSAFRALLSQHEGRAEFSQLLTDMRQAIEQEDTVIRTARQDLANAYSQTDLQEGCRQILGQTNKLAVANHRVRDTLDEAVTGIVGYQEQGRAVDAEPVPVVGRQSGFELALARWWQDDPEHRRQLAVALFDVDEVGQINEEYGPKAGDVVLHAVEQLCRRSPGETARWSGFRASDSCSCSPMPTCITPPAWRNASARRSRPRRSTITIARFA